MDNSLQENCMSKNLTSNLSRREFIRAAGCSIAFWGLSSTAGCLQTRSKQAARPNVLLILTDDQGYGDMSCLGNPVLQTPQLDHLYTQSVRLTDFHSAPLCSPTRAQLMTGQDAVRTGCWGTTWGISMPRRELPTLADMFTGAGYSTAIFGKWHLGDNYPYRPQDRGFQEVLIHGGGGIGQSTDYWGNDYFDDMYLHNGVWEKYSGYCTDVWFEQALDFMTRSKHRPFFCYLSTNAPHHPFLVAEKYSQPFLDKGLNEKLAKFYGMVSNIDENMGKLMDTLRREGLWENTILIFTTDNGSVSQDFNCGMKEQKGSYYDGGHRVPCFIHWPAGQLTGGRDIHELTCCQDVMPTLADLCGIKLPRTAQPDGVSIAGLLQERTDRLSDRMLVVQKSQTSEPPAKWDSAVLWGPWRLVNGTELYQIQNDPGQKRNIADQHPDTVKKMRAHYEQWWRDVSKLFNNVQHIVIGSPYENPVRLCGFDWHTHPTPWTQSHIRWEKGMNGYWLIEVEQGGQYEFALRRWPRETRTPINQLVDRGVLLPVASARITIADVDKTVKVRPEDEEAVFSVSLDKGKTRLQTWFLDESGAELCGAYYVYVKRLQKI